MLLRTRFVLAAVALVVAALPSAALADDRIITKSDAIAVGAAPAASAIGVGGMAGRITQVEVSLNKVSHTRIDDLDVLLVSPSGDAVVVMSDVCPEAATNRYWTFKADTPTPIGAAPGACSDFVYRPANHPGEPDAWAEAPGDHTADLNDFMGEDPNGTWTLRIVDDQPGVDSGSISLGWTLRVVTATADLRLPGDIDGRASQYPSTEPFKGGTDDVVADLDVSLGYLHHQQPADLDIVVVGPSGQTAIVMSTCAAASRSTETCSASTTRPPASRHPTSASAAPPAPTTTPRVSRCRLRRPQGPTGRR